VTQATARRPITSVAPGDRVAVPAWWPDSSDSASTSPPRSTGLKEPYCRSNRASPRVRFSRPPLSCVTEFRPDPRSCCAPAVAPVLGRLSRGRTQTSSPVRGGGLNKKRCARPAAAPTGRKYVHQPDTAPGTSGCARTSNDCGRARPRAPDDQTAILSPSKRSAGPANDMRGPAEQGLAAAGGILAPT